MMIKQMKQSFFFGQCYFHCQVHITVEHAFMIWFFFITRTYKPEHIDAH